MLITKDKESKTYSQSGEDGIIQYIFENIGYTNKIAVEIGVSAGGETNTQLLGEKGFELIWIDSQPKLHIPYNCTFRRQFLTKDNVNKVFELLNIPLEFDILSIDIDGNDYYIREQLKSYNPRVIVMEYNGCYNSEEEYIMSYEESYVWNFPSTKFGASLTSLTKQADRLGYDLVYCTENGVNSFFIRKDINVFTPQSPKQAWKELIWYTSLKIR